MGPACRRWGLAPTDVAPMTANTSSHRPRVPSLQTTRLTAESTPPGYALRMPALSTLAGGCDYEPLRVRAQRRERQVDESVDGRTGSQVPCGVEGVQAVVREFLRADVVTRGVRGGRVADEGLEEVLELLLRFADVLRPVGQGGEFDRAVLCAVVT